MNKFKTNVTLTNVCARLDGDDIGWIDLTVDCEDGLSRTLRWPEYDSDQEAIFRIQKGKKMRVWGNWEVEESKLEVSDDEKPVMIRVYRLNGFQFPL